MVVIGDATIFVASHNGSASEARLRSVVPTVTADLMMAGGTGVVGTVRRAQPSKTV